MVEYPQYGIDRLILENGRHFKDAVPGDDSEPNLPEDLDILFKLRTKQIPDSVKYSYDKGMPREAKLNWVMHQWLDKYLYPRTVLIGEDEELQAWRDVLSDGAGQRKLNEDHFCGKNERYSRRLTLDSHLIPKLFGSISMTLVTGHDHTLTGDAGLFSTTLDTQNKQVRGKLAASDATLATLVSEGLVERSREDQVHDMARRLLGE